MGWFDDKWWQDFANKVAASAFVGLCVILYGWLGDWPYKWLVAGIVLIACLAFIWFYFRKKQQPKQDTIPTHGALHQLTLKSESVDLGIQFNIYNPWHITNAGMSGTAKPKHMVPLKHQGDIVIGVSCKVTFDSDIMRFGIKFFPNNVNPFPTNRIESDGTWLFHIGRDGKGKDPFALAYEGTQRRTQQKFHAYPDISIDSDPTTSVHLSLEYTKNGLKVVVDGREVDRVPNIPVEDMTNMALVAWVDRGEPVSFYVNELQIQWRPIERGPMPEGVIGDPIERHVSEQQRQAHADRKKKDAFAAPAGEAIPLERQPANQERLTKPAPEPIPPRQFDYRRAEQPRLDRSQFAVYTHQVVHQFRPASPTWDVDIPAGGPPSVLPFNMKNEPLRSFQCRVSAHSDSFHVALVPMAFSHAPSVEGYPIGLVGETGFCASHNGQAQLIASIRFHRALIKADVPTPNSYQFDIGLMAMRITGRGNFRLVDLLINGTIVLSHQVRQEELMGFQLVAWSEGEPTKLTVEYMQGATETR